MQINMHQGLCLITISLGLLPAARSQDTIDCNVNSLKLQKTAAQVAITINDAIVRCAANATHHGIVRLPHGTYHTGSLIVRSYINLHVPAGTHLKASLKREHYGWGRDGMALIRLQNCTHCSLTGAGTLDGRGRKWVSVRWPTRKLTRNWHDPRSCPMPSECRPNLVKVVDATQAVIDGLRLVDAAYWTVHVLRSGGVNVTGLRIRNDPLIANTDGIDADGSSDVRVHNVSILTGDDAIVVKTTQPGAPLSGLLVSNCTLQTRSAAIKIGSETRSNLSAMRFEDIKILPSHRGVAFQLRDEGHVSDVDLRDITMTTELYNASWWGAGEPVAITALPRTHHTRLGSISGVRLRGIEAVSENGILIAGSPGSLIRNITFQDVDIRLQRLTQWPGGLQDRRPGYQGVVESPSYLIFQEHATQLNYTNVQLSWSKDRPEWQGVFGGKPHSIGVVHMTNFSVHDEAVIQSSQRKHVHALQSAVQVGEHSASISHF